MSKNAMAGAVTLCGVGLCMIGGAMMMQNGAQAHAAGTMPAAAAAVAMTASAQAGGEPTVVWYSVTPLTYEQVNADGFERFYIYRAWSDGTVEYRTVRRKTQTFSPNGNGGWNLTAIHYCENAGQCTSPWIQCSTPTEGFKAAADMNADELVDGADLATVLSNWGDAPRVPFPPSDCPLNLINP